MSTTNQINLQRATCTRTKIIQDLQLFVKIKRKLRKLKFIKEWDPLTMGYFDNFDNGPLKKYKKS
jgi:hypothetical protein